MSEHLKSIIQDLINGRGEQASVTFNKYVTAKTQGLAGLTEETLTEGRGAKEILTHSAKLLGVDAADIKIVWPNTAAWKTWNDIADALPTRKADDSYPVGSGDDEGTQELTKLKSKDGVEFVMGEFNDYGGGDDPHYIVPKKTKKVVTE